MEKKNKTTFLLVAIFCLLLLSSFLLLFIWGWQGIYYPRESSDITARSFLVKKGEGLFQIASNLEEQDIIESRFLFTLYILVRSEQASLQAGTYYLNPAMRVPEISEKIISGSVAGHKITIPEGWNLRDIGWYFEDKSLFQAEEFFELAGFPAADYTRLNDPPPLPDFSPDYKFLEGKAGNIGLEGYLFPDTYFLEVDKQRENREGAEEIIRKMLDNFDKKVDPDLRKEIEKKGFTISEIVNMASLLEKEVQGMEDKKVVAGILWKRMENDIPLQVDATISYITGKRTVNISREETEIDSPYNTYEYLGLPVGPICNPGLESIKAALYPQETNYWYYLSTPAGETIFNETLEGHNKAKIQYLK